LRRGRPTGDSRPPMPPQRDRPGQQACALPDATPKGLSPLVVPAPAYLRAADGARDPYSTMGLPCVGPGVALRAWYCVVHGKWMAHRRG